MKSNIGATVALAVMYTGVIATGVEYDPGTVLNGNFCAFSNEKVPFAAKAVENCGTVVPESTNSPPLCFALIRELIGSDGFEVVMRGCWPVIGTVCHELSQVDDKAGACLRRTSGNDSLTLCCCEGPLCNQNLQPIRTSNLEDETPETIPPAGGNVVLDSKYGHTLLYVAVIFVLLAIIVAVAFVLRSMQRHQRLKEDDKRDPAKSGLRTPLSGEVTLLEEVDRGNFGVVWRGLCQLEPVAVKICQIGSPRIRLNEVEIYCLPGMKHPNILEFLGARQQSNGRSSLMEHWLLTTWHEMGNLEDHLRANTLTRRQLFRLAESIARGVMHLHSDATIDGSKKPAIAHRDIKSKNILLKTADTACIADLGLAIVFDKGIPIGNFYSQAGTPRYMAPEVLDNAVFFDQQAFQMMDMYAVALVIWELMSRVRTSSSCAEYKLPYEELVGRQASIEDMLLPVVYHNQRPQIQDAWWTDESFSVVANILRECWDGDAEARLNASLVYERLHSLKSEHVAVEVQDDPGYRDVLPLMKRAPGSPPDVVQASGVKHL